MSFKEFLNEQVTRYSIEMNYRTSLPEIMSGYAKLLLGYISAAMKSNNYHVKLVLDNDPMRIIISTRNWDDGERILVVSFHKPTGKFIVSKGFYNKTNKSVNLDQHNKTLSGHSASELVKEILPYLHETEKEEPKLPKLRPLKLKTGPKPWKK